MMGRLSPILAGFLIGLVFAGAAAAVPAFPAYPKTHAEVGRWLASQTDLPLTSVVLVGQGYVFAFVPPDPAPAAGGLVWKQVREEATSAVMAARLNGRSATASIAFDCGRGQAIASDVIVYTGNSLTVQPGHATPAADWLTANPGLYLMDLAKAACDPNFKRPFASLPTSLLVARPASDTDPSPPINEPPVRRAAPETGPVHWVQVGAFTSLAAATHKWREIERLLPAQSVGRSVRTEPVAGKTLVRALIGPFRGGAAQSFCTALKARGGDCLVR